MSAADVIRPWRVIRSLRSQIDAQERSLTTVRATLAATRKERDNALLLLRVLRSQGLVPAWPDPIGGAVNCATAIESEGDMDEADRQVGRWLSEHGITPDEVQP